MKKQELIEIGKNFGIQKNDVEQIILKQTGLSKQQFFLDDKIKLDKKNREKITEKFRKLSFGYPIEYILEKAEFYGHDFFVDKRCLIPRNDTEVMVDEAITEISEYGRVYYIDVGTGSGAIPISIVDSVGHNIDKAYALDISSEALDIAKINILNHNLDGKIKLLQSDLLKAIPPFQSQQDLKFIITANLPYIKDEDYGNIDKEVILHEPALALYGGTNTGFELYEKLIFQTLELKKINNTAEVVLFIEIGFDQKKIAEDFLQECSLNYKVFKDNGGVERCIKIKF